MFYYRAIRKSMASIKTKFVDYEKGPAENLFLNERELPQPEDHYLMKIRAVGLNRAETLHRLGRYPISN
jgi:NADPH:quinone reductase-like Zn-dependent oxidoreductase